MSPLAPHLGLNHQAFAQDWILPRRMIKVRNMIHLPKAGAAALLILLASAAVAKAEDPQLLGEFDDWAAYSYKASDTKVCYVSSRPKSSEPKNVKRDPAFFLVTHMPGRKVKGEVSTLIGYPFKKESNAELTIDEAKYSLYTNADGAWADSPATEKDIVAAMKAGRTLKVKGTSWRGTVTEDTYSLVGISAALAAIDKACK